VLFVEAPDALFAMGSQLPPVFAVENHPFLQVFRGTFPNVSADQRLDLLFDQLIFGMFQRRVSASKLYSLGSGCGANKGSKPRRQCRRTARPISS
jgi:hypothetical protein